jgi:hypothetical protein
MKKKAMAKVNCFRGKEKSENEIQVLIFQKDGKKLQATTVIFLPNTRGIILKKMRKSWQK